MKFKEAVNEITQRQLDAIDAARRGKKKNKWNWKKYDKMTKGIRQDMKLEYSGRAPDDIVWQIAKDMLRDDPGLEQFLKSSGVVDTIGRLANDI